MKKTNGMTIFREIEECKLSEAMTLGEQEYVIVDDILQDLEDTIEKGNVEYTKEGRNGFSPAMWISDLKKKLKGD